jgi:hypothetical protein
MILLKRIPIIPSGDVVNWSGFMSSSVGMVPETFGIVVMNETGAALHTSYNHQVTTSALTYEYS